jgi:hypothetical protein
MKMKLFVFASLLIGSLALVGIGASDAHATGNIAFSKSTSSSLTIFAADTPTDTGDAGDFGGGDTGSFDTASTCKVDGIGWIVCPVIREMAKVVDAAYGVVGKLLQVAPVTTSPQLEAAWSIMRNFANVAFVIAFMFIIFSQLTSIGLNNYGIKKMLPRLIVAAILVNVSFWICAIAVDISNILGVSLNGIFVGIQNGLPDAANTNPIGDGTGWQGIAGLVLAGTAAVGIALYIGLSALLPAVLAAAVAIVTVFIVLTVRQALVILLIVVSPLAFVAYLLPNTESLFKKWFALFKTMLLMYPIIAMLFGASALASTIVMTSASAVATDYVVAIQIMGALISIVPLALTPIIMKTAGSVLGRVGAFVNNPNKGPFDRMRKGAEGVRKRQEGRRAIRELNGEKTMGFGKFRRSANKSRIETGIESEKKRAEAIYLSNKTVDSEAFRNKAAGGLNVGGPNAPQEAMQRALNSAIDVQAQIEVSEIKAASAQIEHAAIPNEMIQALALGHQTYKHINDDGSKEDRNVTLGNSLAMRKAAIQQQVGSGQADKISELVDQYGGKKGEESKILANALQSSGSRPGWIGAGAIEAIRQGEATGNAAKGLTTTQSQMESAIKSGAYSADKMVTADADELKMLASYVHSTNDKATAEQKVARDALVKNAQTALSDPILSTKLGKRGSNIEAIAFKQPGTDPAPARTIGVAAAQAQAPAQQAPPKPQNPPTTQNVPQAPVQQPGTLNIQHDLPKNPNIGRTSMPPNSGSATILKPKGPDDNRQ